MLGSWKGPGFCCAGGREGAPPLPSPPFPHLGQGDLRPHELGPTPSPKSLPTLPCPEGAVGMPWWLNSARMPSCGQVERAASHWPSCVCSPVLDKPHKQETLE